MSLENELLFKCLDLAKHTVSNNLITNISIKVGTEFYFEFNNNDVLKNELSPSQKRRNHQRQEHFWEKNMKKNDNKIYKSKCEVKEVAAQTEQEVKDASVQTTVIEKKTEFVTNATQTSHLITIGHQYWYNGREL